jgi:endonuclease YncB( thermonuclease family)
MRQRAAATSTFRWLSVPLARPAKVLDGDTIVVAGQLVTLHGIDAPKLDQTFQWRGQQIGCGTMSLAALEARIARLRFAARLSSETGTVPELTPAPRSCSRG